MKKTYVYPQLDCVCLKSDVITTSLFEIEWGDGEELPDGADAWTHG